MDLAFEDVEGFKEQQRRRRLLRVAVVGCLAVGAWLAYQRYHTRLEYLMPLVEERSPDDPRVLLGAGSESIEESVEVVQVRRLLSHELPAYVDALRRYRKRNARSPGSDSGEELAGAREALLARVGDDDALRAVVTVLTRLGEQDLAGHGDRILELFEGLDVILAERNLPFQTEATLVEEAVPTLRVRSYERIAESRFRVGGQTLPVPYLERLDLTNLPRDPDELPWEGRNPAVPVRAVLAAANRALLASLHPGGCWCVSRVEPPQALAWVESTIGAQVLEDWRSELTGRTSPAAWRALEKVSEAVAHRNAILRDVNQRDPSRLVTPNWTSVRLNWYGEAWLDQMYPYAARGLVRMQIEDIVRLREYDKAVAEPLEGAGPALRELFDELFRLASAGEVQRARLVRTGRLPERLTGRWGGVVADDRGVAWVVERLTALAVGPVSCAAAVGDLTFEAVDGTNAVPATWVLAELSRTVLRATDLDATSLAAAVRPLLEASCPDLSQKARTLFERHLGPWEPVENDAVMGIARQAPVSH